MKFLIISLFFLLFGICEIANAQTHLIAHKSHSGKMAAFKEYIFFEEGIAGGFGRGPEPTIREAYLDSVIFLSDDKAVMVTSEVCTDRRRESAISIWRAGKDTMHHHPLFSQQHALDSIKATLKNFYYFRNPIDSVRFVGYDNGEEEVEPTEPAFTVLPGGQDGSNHPGAPGVSVISSIFLISIIAAFFVWLFRRTTIAIR